MILIKDRHTIMKRTLILVEIGKYDTYKGSTQANSLVVSWATMCGKYDTYKGSTRFTSNVENKSFTIMGNMILIKDRHNNIITNRTDSAKGKYDTYKE